MADHHFEHHRHDAVVHSHEHWHVTHNFSEMAGTFEHLASQHAHAHDHAELEHSHYPHRDFESEHKGEAHEHYHADPVGDDQGGRAPAAAKNATTKKTAAKKSTTKKATAKKAAKKA
jgi:hypothetical protein